jgi:DNA (cytosine-5)-methyltransferase 1
MSYKLLDAFCGEGGCSMGYKLAGFEVTGVDITEQKRYPFAFVKGDALEYMKAHGKDFDVIHASPPCKAFTKTGWALHFGYHANHKDLLTPARIILESLGVPYVIENVPGAPLRADFMLCGSQFGLGVRRHRLFETSPRLFSMIAPCAHNTVDASPHGHPRRAGEGATWGPAMGIDWMSTAGLAQAIPPAFTKYIGEKLIAVLESGFTSANTRSLQAG